MLNFSFPLEVGGGGGQTPTLKFLTGKSGVFFLPAVQHRMKLPQRKSGT